MKPLWIAAAPAGPTFREGKSQCLFRWVVDLSLSVL